MKKQMMNVKQIIAFFIVVTICMTVGSFYDFDISKNLVNQENLVGILGAIYGQLPFLLCLSVSGFLLVLASIKEKGKIGRVEVFLGILTHVIAIGKTHLDQVLYFDIHFILSILMAVIIILGIDYFFYLIFKNDSCKCIRRFVGFVLLVSLGQIILVNILKLTWSRPRMRMILSVENAQFQPWWVIGCNYKEAFMELGIKAEEFKSFPSGHMSAATCTFILCVLPCIKENFKKYQRLIFTGCCLFVVFVGVSRIIMGAHFLTDITIGFSCTMVVLLLAYQYYQFEN